MTYAEKVNGALLMDGIIGRTIKEEDIIEGVPAMYAPKTMKASNLIGGGTIALSNLMTGEVIPVIIYDDCYDKLNNDGKDFLIYHELSHIQHGDYMMAQKDQIKYFIACKLWIAKIEVLADIGCTKRIGRKRTLSGMLNLIRTCKDGYVQMIRRMIALNLHYAIGTIVK